MVRLLVLAATSAAILAQSVSATTIRVPEDQPDIQAGINAAVHGDTVLVGPGLYTGPVDFNEKGICLASSDGHSQTRIRQTGSSSFVVDMSDIDVSGAELTGFSIDSSGTSEGAVKVWNSVAPYIRINGCSFTSNSTLGVSEGVISIRDCDSVVVQDNAFLRNKSDAGGAITSGWCDHLVILQNQFVEDSAQHNYGGAITVGHGRLTMEYNVFLRNVSLVHGGAVFLTSLGFETTPAVVRNNTFVDNSAGTSGGAICLYICDQYVFIESNVFYGNDGYAIALEGEIGLPTLDCNVAHVNSPNHYGAGIAVGINDVFADPLFCDLALDDLTVWDISPCVPANNPCGSLVGARLIGCYVYAGPVWHVALSGDDQSGDGTEVNPFASIQRGIDGASVGDTVLVHSGTYSGNGNRDIDFGGKAICVRSKIGPDETFIECGGSEMEPHRGFVFVNQEDTSSKVVGFTIQGGFAPFDYLGSYSAGGAVLCTGGSSPTIEDCVISDNYAVGYGGGVAVRGCQPVLNDCIFQSNSCAHGSGGIFAHSAVLTVNRCSFVGNAAQYGGALWCDHSEASLLMCEIEQNIAPRGGGIYNNNSKMIIENCFFLSNEASIRGGGIFQRSDAQVFRDCLFAKNSSPAGGAIFTNDCDAEFTNCTFVANAADSGGAMFCSGFPQPSIYNSIIAYSEEGDGVYGLDPLPDISCVDMYGNEGGDWIGNLASIAELYGNFSLDPIFCDTGSGNYSLSLVSPCHEHVTCGSIGWGDAGCLSQMITDFAIEGELSESHIISHIPVFSWNHVDSVDQAAFEIAVGIDDNWDYAEMWNPVPEWSSDTSVGYSGGLLEDAATYFLRLRISDGTDWSSWYTTTFRMNSLPSLPQLSLPIDSGTVGDMPWLWVHNATDAEADALVYDFLWARDTSYGTADTLVEFNVPEGTDSTGWQVGSVLTENDGYVWSARAYDGYEYSDWSPSRFFLVDAHNEAPSIPLCASPPSRADSIHYDMVPMFTWGESVDPDPADTVRYRLRVSINPTFTFATTVDPVETNNFQWPDSLDFDDKYWWTVAAYDRDGLTVWATDTLVFYTWTLGDVTHDHIADLSDVLAIAHTAFLSGPPIEPAFVGDVTGDCMMELTDILWLASYLFLGGTPPVPGCE